MPSLKARRHCAYKSVNNTIPHIMKRFILMAAACAFALTACHNHEGEGHDEHEGHHHHEVLCLSAYSDSWEVFAEVAPLEKGEERTIAAHFTRLEDFKPAEQGPASMTLTVGSSSKTSSLDSPTETGIYKFEVTPDAAGDASLTFSIAGETLTIDTKVFDDEEEAEEYAEENEAKSGNGVAFAKEKAWNIDFRTDEVTTRRTGNIIRTMALVELPESGEAILTAKSSGVVAVNGGSLPEGSAVRSGATLFTIEGSSVDDTNLSIRYVEAENSYNLAKAEYERKLSLSEDKIVSESELLQAKKEYETAKAVYDNIRASYSGGKQGISSPISGFVTKISVRNGEYVEAGQTLAIISRSDKLCLVAEVPARYYGDLARFMDATIRPVNGKETFDLNEMDGKMVSYAKSAENGLIPVHFHLRNTSELVPGTYVEMFLTTEGDSETLCVPDGAIIEEMGNHFVFKQLTPEFFEKTQVTTGATDGKYTAILKGLSEGDRVVSRGAILVKLSQASGALDPHAGHVH